MAYSDLSLEELRAELKKRGITYGPLSEQTRFLYEKKLAGADGGNVKAKAPKSPGRAKSPARGRPAEKRSASQSRAAEKRSGSRGRAADKRSSSRGRATEKRSVSRGRKAAEKKVVVPEQEEEEEEEEEEAVVVVATTPSRRGSGRTPAPKSTGKKEKATKYSDLTLVQLRAELKKRDMSHGPVNSSTRDVYEKKLVQADKKKPSKVLVDSPSSSSSPRRQTAGSSSVMQIVSPPRPGMYGGDAVVPRTQKELEEATGGSSIGSWALLLALVLAAVAVILYFQEPDMGHLLLIGSNNAQ